MSPQLFTIYQKLHSAYGVQGWWPITPDGETVPRYDIPISHSLHRFEIAVGAILTQNTAWANVEKALVALHENKLLTPQKIVSTPHEKLAQIIRSAGYFNQKAERLKVVAYFFLSNDITKLPLTILRTKLLALKGIGPETADSIILYAAKKPVFVIDAYTRRIFSRLGFLQESDSYDNWQELFHREFFPPGRRTKSKGREVNSELLPLFKEYHALLVEHAKQHCKKKPICHQCPLEKACKKRL